MNAALLMIYFPLALASTLLPGPSATLALSHGAAYGAWRTWPTIVGVNLAVLVMMLLSYSGVGSLASEFQEVFDVYRWVCTAVLVWIAWGMWRSPSAESKTPIHGTTPSPSSSAGALFLRGFLVSASNPKALGFFFLVFPGFIAASGAGVTQFVVLAAIWLLCETLGLALYAASGSRLLHWMSNRGGMQRLNRLCAALIFLMILAMWMVPVAR
jgi:homoserine/homoserine lactone efflux protein